MKVEREVDRDAFIRRLDQRLRALEAEVARLRQGAPTPAVEQHVVFSKWWWDRTYQWLSGGR